jgi:hypothetical protein
MRLLLLHVMWALLVVLLLGLQELTSSCCRLLLD